MRADEVQQLSKILDDHGDTEITGAFNVSELVVLSEVLYAAISATKPGDQVRENYFRVLRTVEDAIVLACGPRVASYLSDRWFSVLDIIRP